MHKKYIYEIVQVGIKEFGDGHKPVGRLMKIYDLDNDGFYETLTEPIFESAEQFLSVKLKSNSMNCWYYDNGRLLYDSREKSWSWDPD